MSPRALLLGILLSCFAFAALIESTFLLYGLSALACIALYDVFQRKHTILRNFPLIGHFRYILEMIRPEINQYFVESNTDGKPFSREQRSLVYQRSKGQLDTLPFGTQREIYETGYEWVNHSLNPVEVPEEALRIQVGQHCAHPYQTSLLNISAMSFGSLSSRAVLALNKGAHQGGFAHNTGEGGISRYHLEHKGDLIYQLGTGYFGSRRKDGTFDPDKFAETANQPTVKMIELKLSQGAKPGHGGILPAAKVNGEIARARGVTPHHDVISPPGHSAFKTPLELLSFVEKLRTLSGGKPVGFKLCLGRRREFMSIVKAMVETKLFPDFITVDGGEGGTGAAPLEFSNAIGFPAFDGLYFVHNALRGAGIRDQIKIQSSGKIVSGFDLLKHLCLGADFCASARSMMMAIGCIQALRCNTNECPTGVATQKRHLVRGLDVDAKAKRTFHYHCETLKSFSDILGAMGMDDPKLLTTEHIQRRTQDSWIERYDAIYNPVEWGGFFKDECHPIFLESWNRAQPESF